MEASASSTKNIVAAERREAHDAGCRRPAAKIVLAGPAPSRCWPLPLPQAGH